MKLCKDCRWASIPRHVKYLPELGKLDMRCTHPSSQVPAKYVDYVTGQPVPPRIMVCLEARNDPDDKHCGPEGCFWEERDQTIGFGV